MLCINLQFFKGYKGLLVAVIVILGIFSLFGILFKLIVPAIIIGGLVYLVRFLTNKTTVRGV